MKKKIEKICHVAFWFFFFWEKRPFFRLLILNQKSGLKILFFLFDDFSASPSSPEYLRKPHKEYQTA